MDQSLKDQNSETRDFSASDEGDDHDNVNLMDMELKPQIEDEIHSSADFLESAFNLSFTSKAAGDLRSAFSEYQLVWVSLMDFTAYASLPEQRQEQQTLEEIMRTRKEIVQAAIIEGIDRKNDLL